MKFTYTVDEKNSGRTVLSILKHNFEFSDNLIKKMKYNGKILCNKTPVFVVHTVKTGDIVEADVNFDETSENIESMEMELNILYEDDAVIALDKPAGVVVNPIGAHTEKTLANGLKHYYESKGYSIRIRPVSRLDKDTTGVIVFAKNSFVHDKLVKQMHADEYHKGYIGIVHGCPSKASGTIELPIARTPGSIMLREISEAGAPSITHYSVMEYLSNAAVVSFTLETGRTHQIRVHCLAKGHPLIGDTLYSDLKTELIARQALHSNYVRFKHPVTGKSIEIESPLPKDMKLLIAKLKAGYS